MKTLCLIWVLILMMGCSAAGTRQAGRHLLSPTEAAELAARLANDECEHLYRKRPFAARQQPAVPSDDGYRWGGLDEGGPGGYSALVVFEADGSHPKVEVYFSTDIRRLTR
jgi:hypothetical protein